MTDVCPEISGHFAIATRPAGTRPTGGDDPLACRAAVCLFRYVTDRRAAGCPAMRPHRPQSDAADQSAADTISVSANDCG